MYFYRVPSMDAHYQDSVHLAKRFKSRFLEIDQLETMVAMDIWATKVVFSNVTIKEDLDFLINGEYVTIWVSRSEMTLNGTLINCL
jgi:hypothetical protein